jgi:RHS repeat-associated protein
VGTGLDYFLARYYKSVQGRFTSLDEFTGGPGELYDFAESASANPFFYGDLTNPQSLNKYQYSYNNPLRYVDLDEHDPDDEQQGQQSQSGSSSPGIPVPGPPVSPQTINDTVRAAQQTMEAITELKATATK